MLFACVVGENRQTRYASFLQDQQRQKLFKKIIHNLKIVYDERFTNVMANQSDDELMQILTKDRFKYKEEAIEAAELEIANRGLQNKIIESQIIKKSEPLIQRIPLASFEKRLFARVIDSTIVTISVYLGINIYNINEPDKYQIQY